MLDMNILKFEMNYYLNKMLINFSKQTNNFHYNWIRLLNYNNNFRLNSNERLYSNKRLYSTRSKAPFQTDVIVISPEVKHGLLERKSVVALESTIITHGMPFPANVETAIEVEQIVRESGSIPATIGIIKGKIFVGMNVDQIYFLSKNTQTPAPLIKVSRGDLPVVLAKGLSGGTTVSATSLISHLCGIQFFATGGIGGVHRGGEVTMDISCDLTELGKTPVTVISAGVKSILDIEKTLEVLETQGVCVVVYNGDNQDKEQTENHNDDSANVIRFDDDAAADFPAFFSSKSGHKVPYQIKRTQDAATIVHKHEQLGLGSGVLVAVPLPQRASHFGQIINNAIDQALREANQKQIKGKPVTPFVLKRVNELTEGKSLSVNIDIIKNNARIASEISIEYEKLKLISHSSKKEELLTQDLTSASDEDPHQRFLYQGSSSKLSKTHNEFTNKEQNDQSKHKKRMQCLRPVIIGGSILDIVATTDSHSLNLNGSTYKGVIKISLGGVGRNLSDCLTRLNHDPLFISVVGDDPNGNSIINHNSQMDHNGIIKLKQISTSSCVVILDDKGESKLHVGDMKAHDYISCEHILKFKQQILQAPLVMIDANIPLESIKLILNLCSENRIPVWYEPTDANLAAKLFSIDKQHFDCLMFTSPNLNELKQMSIALGGPTKSDININSLPPSKLIDVCKDLALPLEDYFHTIVITLGESGAVIISRTHFDYVFPFGNRNQLSQLKSNSNTQSNVMHIPQDKMKENLISVSGAGDCFAGAMVSGLLNGKTIAQSAQIGMKAAKISLFSHESVPSILQSKHLYDQSYQPKLDEPKLNN